MPTPTVGNGGTGQPRVSNIVIDGVNFHDITRDNTPTEHDECLFIQGVSHITVRNSRFSNCAIMDIYLHGISGEQNPDDVHLLNNNFGADGIGHEQRVLHRPVPRRQRRGRSTGSRSEATRSVSR